MHYFLFSKFEFLMKWGTTIMFVKSAWFFSPVIVLDVYSTDQNDKLQMLFFTLFNSLVPGRWGVILKV